MNEQTGAKLKKLDSAIARYVRPDTFQLAVRMVPHGETIPKHQPQLQRELESFANLSASRAATDGPSQ